MAVEPPVKTTYRGYEVYACGPWSLGPVVHETLNILEGFDDFGALGHNSPGALHLIAESLKLAFCDRHSRCRAWQAPAPYSEPRLVLQQDRLVMPFGTPGNDRQPQAMAQFLVNLIDFGLDVQQAVEAPRVATYSFPATGDPHPYDPGLLRVEESLPPAVRADLERLGHRVEVYNDDSFEGFGSICAILADRESSVLHGAADPTAGRLCSGLVID